MAQAVQVVQAAVDQVVHLLELLAPLIRAAVAVEAVAVVLMEAQGL
jgi:hypothetical protein